MLSTDPSFYLYAGFIFIVFYSVRSPLAQLLTLSGGSFAMYATEGTPFLVLLAISSLLNALCSFIAASQKPRRAKLAMISGVSINLAILLMFKYKSLLIPDTVANNSNYVSAFLSLGLPIGVSFYSFHGISLVVDCWHQPNLLRHRQNFLRHCLDTSLYLAFFPQLVAGPITKGRMFFPQMIFKRFADIPWASAGRDIIVGIFLKRVIADNLNQLTLQLTDARTYPLTPQAELIAMMIGYSAQIFADFAGYSLIAIGVAKLFGYNLPANFNQPYLSQSITDFWRRWHPA
jgi:alginate O-acetyltransferase complex protein AlgI